MNNYTDINALMADDKQYIANTYARVPLAFKSGKGSLITGMDGREYIDMGSGIAVSTFGLCDDEMIAAATTQLNIFAHTSNYYYSEPQAKLAALLCEKMGMKKVFFSNSGAEANECAIKAARKYSFDKYGADRHNIITLKNSFHGRTMATITATGQDAFHKYFDPFLDGFLYADANDIEQIKNLAGDKNCAAVMIELIQGEGGVNDLDKAYVSQLAQFCAEQDILLIIDEVQTGCGRCGSFLCADTYGVKPDIVTSAKGLAGGLPIGATLFGEKTADTLGAGSHGSTFGGNPVSAAAAVSVVSRLNDALYKEVTEKSEYIKAELSGAKGIKSISGIGLMIGIETEKEAKKLAEALLQKGILVLTAQEKLRLLPALNIPFELLKKAVAAIKEETGA